MRRALELGDAGPMLLISAQNIGALQCGLQTGMSAVDSNWRMSRYPN